MDCRPLQKGGATSETTWFIIACVKELTVRHGVEWIFLLEKGGEGLALPAEGKQLLRKVLPGRLGDRLWYRWLMPRMARREGVDLVMTEESGTKGAGGRRLSGGGRLGKQESGGRIPSGAGNDLASKMALCSWGLSGEGLSFSFDGREIRVPLAPDEEVRSLSVEEREKWKEDVAGGREYFFADVTGLGAARVMNLLKAFSLFKKRQLSNMKLVLAGAGPIEKLDSYKYREDICLYPGRTKDVTGAAYSIIHTPRRNDTGIVLLNAWRAKTPVITLANETGGKTVPEGVLRVKDDIGEVAEAMKSLYKNEGIRNELIEKGTSRVAGLSIRGSVEVIWELLVHSDMKTN